MRPAEVTADATSSMSSDLQTSALTVGDLRESLQSKLQQYADDSKHLEHQLLPRSHQQHVGASALAASYLQMQVVDASVPSETSVRTHLEALKAHLVARREELDKKKHTAAMHLDAAAAVAAASGSSESRAAAALMPLSQLSAELAALPPASSSSDGWVSASGVAPTLIDMLEEAGLIERHPDGLGRVRKNPLLRLPWTD